MTYQEKIDIIRGSVYDYDDYCDSCPDYFDYDEPNDFDDGYGFVGPVEYKMCCVFVDRMAPVMKTHRPHQDIIARLTPVTRPTHTELCSATRSPVLFMHLDLIRTEWAG